MTGGTKTNARRAPPAHGPGGITMLHIESAGVSTTDRARKRSGTVATVLAAAVVGLLPGTGVAQQPTQRTFASPDEASESLFVAVQSDNVPALRALFGPAADEVIASGDSAEDAKERAHFVRKYQEMHRLAKDSAGTTIIYVGAENWPLPIPLVQADGGWRFDTEAGVDEIRVRRIGRNELAAIRVCHALVDAERDYYATSHDGSAVRSYASRIVSDSGTEDGLYWRSSGDEPSSPIGPLLAGAAAGAGAAPFHGYYYRLLTRQGASAHGGAKAYVINGKLRGGFAVVAFPADYQSSGVMTFIVNQADSVYQKDLGPNTPALARDLGAFDPDSTWRRAEP